MQKSLLQMDVKFGRKLHGLSARGVLQYSAGTAIALGSPSLSHRSAVGLRSRFSYRAFLCRRCLCLGSLSSRSVQCTCLRTELALRAD